MDEETCYGPASIAGAIIGTLLITLALAGGALLLYNIYWRSRKGKHLVLMTDVENPADQYAFDNPNFREATPVKQSPSPVQEKSGKLDLSWLGGWSPLQVFSTPRNDKQRAFDDSFVGDSQLKVVSLKSHDFTGLGFSVCGNMRDGIFVKDLLHRGPAFESGCINPGDRIDSVCISFRHMVFEDALTILSYASPYEVQVQVEHNATSRPATLLRKRDTSAPSASERILHPFYRSQSIADLATIGKNNDKRSNQQGSDRNKPSTDFTSIKLGPTQHAREECTTLERKAPDSVDGTSPPKHAKFGIKVLPMGLTTKLTKENEQTASSEQDVKAMLTKGLMNLKEKINQNTLGRKKKEESPEQDNQEISQDHTCVEIPDEVVRAADVARNNRKSVSAESLAARKSAADLPIPDSDGSSDLDSHQRAKKKGKAPAPPQVLKEVKVFPAASNVISENAILPASSIEKEVLENIFEPTHIDTDSEVEELPITCTQAIVHHSPQPDEVETSRKTASLGDLSRLDDTTSTGPLERAVSLDLDASHGKKRKAPPPPPEDFPGSLDETVYRKEPRLEGYNTFQRRLKKSSDFGTLEDAINDSDGEDQTVKLPENEVDLSSLAANNIKEFSSWLEEVRKPQTENTLTLNVNGSQDDEEEDLVEDVGHNAWDISKEELANNSDLLYSSALSSEVTISPDSKDRESADSGFGVASIPMMESPTSQTSSESAVEGGEGAQTEISSPAEVSPLVVSTSSDSVPSVTEMVFKTYESNAGLSQPYNFSVNGHNLQDASRTVLLISQPNSLNTENLAGDDETPPQLPTSPPPSSSLTYITEIRVSTPENASLPPKGVKPQRKDISPETSRIPVRTMKSETGQKVLAAIQSLAAKEHGSGTSTIVNKDENPPSVAGYHLKKVPPAVPPRRSDASPVWSEGLVKERINGTPMHIQIPTGVSLPVKTSATKIVFESQENNEEF